MKIATPTTKSFSDSGLTPNTTYSYIVRAEDAASNLGPYSNVATVTTSSSVPELVAAYAFDETSASTVIDASGNGRNGTISNATRTTAGKYGRRADVQRIQREGQRSGRRGPPPDDRHDAGSLGQPHHRDQTWRDVIYKGNDNYYLMGPGGSVGSRRSAEL